MFCGFSSSPAEVTEKEARTHGVLTTESPASGELDPPIFMLKHFKLWKG